MSCFIDTRLVLVAENGSGGFMGDLVFTGTSIGIRCKYSSFFSRKKKKLKYCTDAHKRWKSAIYLSFSGVC